MTREKIASPELREKVKTLKNRGLPDPVALDDDVLEALDDNQKAILSSIAYFAELEKRAREKEVPLEEGSGLWDVRRNIRAFLQEAILADLVHLRLVQNYAIGYGAIPDPGVGWKYYHHLLNSNNFLCWECGSEILGKQVAHPVHFAEFRGMVGGGEVRYETVPFCPNCEEEPSFHGIPIRETVAESILRDFPRGLLPRS